MPTNNGLLMRNVVKLCLASVWLQIILWSCVNETTLSSFLRSLVSEKINGRLLRFPKIFIKKQTWWSNDTTIIELGYRNISWFASVSRIDYLPQPPSSVNNWSARHWLMTIFCSTSSNNLLIIVVVAVFSHGTIFLVCGSNFESVGVIV